jgi:ERCC4-type nuclease
METNELLKEQLFDAIRTQIKSNNPPETKLTFERLKTLGYSEMDVMQLIGQCLTMEIYSVLKNQKKFDAVRYNRNLKNLPNQPTEE